MATEAHPTATSVLVDVKGTLGSSKGNDEVHNREEEVEYPGVHVLCGRGGHVTAHPGNVLYRNMVDKYKMIYQNANKAQKPQIAMQIVNLWRNQNPPGRFLERTDPSKGDDSTWREIEDRSARKKTAQSLRERTPTVAQVHGLCVIGNTMTIDAGDGRKRVLTSSLVAPLPSKPTARKRAKRQRKTKPGTKKDLPVSATPAAILPRENIQRPQTGSFLEDYHAWLRTKALQAGMESGTATSPLDVEPTPISSGESEPSIATLSTGDGISISSSEIVTVDDFKWLFGDCKPAP